MNELTIKVAPDLKIDPADNKIKVQLSSENSSSNAFELKDDGIYMNKTFVSAVDGFVNQNDNGFIRIGWPNCCSTLENPGLRGVVSATSVVHKTYDVIVEGEEYLYFRQQVDTLMPGDIIRYHMADKRYSYHVVLKIWVNSTSPAGSSGYMGAGYFAKITQRLCVLDD